MNTNERHDIEIPRGQKELNELLIETTLDNVDSLMSCFSVDRKHAEYNVWHSEQNLIQALNESLLDDGAAYDSFKAQFDADKKVEAEVIEIIRLLAKWKLINQD